MKRSCATVCGVSGSSVLELAVEVAGDCLIEGRCLELASRGR